MDEKELRLSTLSLSAQILGEKSNNLEELFNTSNKLISYIENDQLVKQTAEQNSFSEFEIKLLKACTTNPVEFIQQTKIQYPIKGEILFNLYPFQIDVVDQINKNNSSIILASRQMGTTTLLGLYSLWYGMFKHDQTILIISNSFNNSKEIMDRIRFAYCSLPNYLRSGMILSRKTCIEFDNGSKIIAASADKNAGLGQAITLTVIDNAAFISYSKMNELWTALTPTFASKGKLIISSTPNEAKGLFYELWNSNLLTVNHISIPWNLHPDRTVEFENQYRQILGTDRFDQEFCCKFK